MKFGKLLQSRAEELRSTGLTEHFLRYKALKKTLKQISRKEPQSEPIAGASCSITMQHCLCIEYLSWVPLYIKTGLYWESQHKPICLFTVCLGT